MRGYAVIGLVVLGLGCHTPTPEPGCRADPLRDPDTKCPAGYLVVQTDAGIGRLCMASVIVEFDRPCENR
jgi:hypothetical protein